MEQFLAQVLALFLTWHSGDGGLGHDGDPVQICNATVFAYRGDSWAGGISPCLRRHVRPSDVGIAHRTLPCGSKVTLTNVRTGKVAVGRVVDRGPYGACVRRGYHPIASKHHCKRQDWRLRLRKPTRGRWRGCVDLTPALRHRLGHNGGELVILVPERSNNSVVLLPPDLPQLSPAEQRIY